MCSRKLHKRTSKRLHSATSEFKTTKKIIGVSTQVQQKIAEKWLLRKQWQQTRTTENKKVLNKPIKELILEEQNRGIQEYFESLTPAEASNYSLLKCSPPIRNVNNTWARNDKGKREAFCKYLIEVFKPFPSEISTEDEIEKLNPYKSHSKWNFPMPNSQ